MLRKIQDGHIIMKAWPCLVIVVKPVQESGRSPQEGCCADADVRWAALVSGLLHMLEQMLCDQLNAIGRPQAHSCNVSQALLHIP